jgi:hypothetical protein
MDEADRAKVDGFLAWLLPPKVPEVPPAVPEVPSPVPEVPEVPSPVPEVPVAEVKVIYAAAHARVSASALARGLRLLPQPEAPEVPPVPPAVPDEKIRKDAYFLRHMFFAWARLRTSAGDHLAMSALDWIEGKEPRHGHGCDTCRLLVGDFLSAVERHATYRKGII